MPMPTRPALERALCTALLLACALHGTANAQAAAAQPPDPTRDAYLDETARHLVLGARATHHATRQAINTYSGLVRERLSFDTPTGRRDRPWMRGSRVARVRWSQGAPAAVDIVDEHFRHPGIGPGKPRYFQGLRDDHLPIDPLADPFTLGLAPFMGGDAAAIAVHSPLGHDAERYYQFRSGDTTALQLNDGGTIETIEVTAIPRYRSIRLVAAIMWIDPESHGLVRAAYRPAKRIDHEVSGVLREADGWWLGLRIDPGDTVAAAPPATQSGWFGQLINETFTAVLLGIETDLSSVIVDFAPTQPGRWLPRSVQWTGYTGIESITATGAIAPTLPFTIGWTQEPSDGGEGEGDLRSSPLRADQPPEQAADTRAIGKALAGIGNGDGGDRSEAASPWYLYPPIWTLNLVRYNPVEGVSVGGQLRGDKGWWRSVLTVRAATREWKMPDMDLTLQRDRPSGRIQFSIYRALRTGALGAGGINGFPLPLILERDSLDFHRSTGASMRFLPGIGEHLGFSLSLFAERDEEVETGTLRTRYGSTLDWNLWWGGQGQESIGGGGTVSARSSWGDNPYEKAMVQGALLLPLGVRISLGLQAGMANVSGDPAPHDLWDIGATGAWLRGHSEAIETSRAWMGRADLQFPARFVRLSFFGDWARAEGEDFHAAGAGLVLLDGLLRVDVAQGFRGGREGGPDPALRFHVLVDNLF